MVLTSRSAVPASRQMAKF